VTVVLASEGYPEAPHTGRAIEGIEAAASVPGVHLAHAATAIGAASETGTATDDLPLIATGGRVLNVVAVGDGFAEARRRAYEALGHLRLDGGQYRTDIAARVAE
jgi:phosphoribosylamine--glycine ligase